MGSIRCENLFELKISPLQVVCWLVKIELCPFINLFFSVVFLKI